MRHLIYSFLAMAVCAVTPAFACTPPDFPKPEDITQIEMIDVRKGELTEVERAALDTYRADRERYMELYEQAYPCPLAAGDSFERLDAVNNETMIEELNALKLKWNRAESLPEQGPPQDSDEYVDIPEDDMLIVE